MSETLSVTIYPDNEGFITYECPYCESAFKLRVDDVNDEEWPIDDLFCPYCGLTDTIERFLSEDVVNEVKAQAYNYAVKMLNK